MKVELRIVPDCPDSIEAIMTVRRALDDLGLFGLVCHVLVDDEHPAHEDPDCHESPKVTVDGQDIFHAAGVDRDRDQLADAFVAPSGLPDFVLMRHLLMRAARLG